MWDVRTVGKIDDSDKTAIGHRFCADIYNNRTDLLKCLCDQDLLVSFAGRARIVASIDADVLR
jgi:hypothetical protein